MKPVCKRCGKCCIVYNFKLKRWVHCKFLNNDKSCAIYARRIGQKLDFGFVCTYRDNIFLDYPDCPFNDSNPIHPYYI